MKKALRILLFYVELFAASLLIGTFFYSLFLSVSNFVFGNELKFFSLEYFSKSFFFIAYCVIILICPFIAYYRVRHAGGVLQTVVFVLICLIHWGFFLPGTIRFEAICNRRAEKNKSAKEVKIENTSLSSDYFRELDGKVYYFLDGEDGNVVTIDTSEDGEVEVESDKAVCEEKLISAAGPYKELQIKQNFKQKGIPLFISLPTLINQAKLDLDKGFTFFLGFLSMGFVLCAVYGLSNFFQWRTLATCFIVLVSDVILALNTLFYQGFFVRTNIRAYEIGFVKSLGNFVDQPVVVLANVFFALIFTITGIIKFIVRKNKARKANKA